MAGAGRLQSIVFLQKLLTGFAIASLLLMLVVSILWARSLHHVDHFSLPGIGGSTRADVTSSHGTLMVISTKKTATLVAQQARFYPHQQVIKACLLLPALWLAIFIRAKLLPHRPDRVPGRRRGRPLAQRSTTTEA